MPNFVSLILSLYVTSLVYTHAFFIERLMFLEKVDQQFYNQLGIFLIILLPIYFLLNRLVVSAGGGGARQFVRKTLHFVAALGLFATILYHVVPLESVYDLPAQVDQIFSSETMLTFWLLAPLLVLFI